MDAQSQADEKSERWSSHDGCWIDRHTGWKIREDVRLETVFVDMGTAVYDFPYYVNIFVDPEECIIRIELSHGGLQQPDQSTLVISKLREPDLYSKIKSTFLSLYEARNEQVEFTEASNR